MEARQWLRVSEAADRLLVCPRTIRRWIKLRYFKVRRLNPNIPHSTLLISVASIESIEHARELDNWDNREL